MTLKEWLEANHLHQKQFARLIGASQAAVSCWVRKGYADQRYVERILELTGVCLKPRRFTGPQVNAKRHKRLVGARNYGVSFEDIAERFGFKNSNTAKVMYYHAKEILRRYE